jgi:hypothetical protein
LNVIKDAKRETGAGDTRCRGCDDPKTGTRVLVLAENMSGVGTDPKIRIRFCEPCALKWMGGDEELKRKVENEWKTL